MYSSTLRLTGLATGIDTDSMIKQLMNAESLKMNKLKQKRQLTEWKQLAYREVSSTLVKFQSSFTSLSGAGASTSLRLASNFQSLVSSATQSDGTATTAIKTRTTDASVVGNFNLDVVRTAQKDTYTGTQVDMQYTSQYGMDIGAAMNGSLQVGDSFTISMDGASPVSITLTASDLSNGADYGKIVENINKKLQDRFKFDVGADGKTTTNQKVSAKYNETTKSISIVAGPGHTVEVGTGPEGSDALLKMGYESAGKTGFDSSATLALMGFTSAYENIRLTINDVNFVFDRTDTIEKVMNDINKSTAGVTLSFDTMRSSFKLESNTSGASGAISFVDTDGLLGDKMGMKDSFKGSKSLDDGLTLDNRIEDSDYYKSASLTANMINFKINGVEFSINAGAKISSILDTVNNSRAGVKMTYDEDSRSFSLNKVSGSYNNKIEIEDTDGFLSGFMGMDADNVTTKAHSQEAADALFIYDGLYVSRESNVFEFNGVEITLTEAAVGKSFEIGLTRDIAPTMDLVKNFVTEYNNLVDSLNAQTTTARAKSGTYSHYEPLTDEQRAAMSETEITNWEEKAKTGMLYRDELLTKLTAEFRTMIYTGVTREDGSTISLYDIGITTSSTDRYIGKLQIDETVLRNALENNADAVTDLFTKSSDMPGTTPEGRKARLTDEGLGDRLNDIIRNAVDVGGSIYTRAGTETYKTSELHKQLETQDTKISDMLDYLVRRENYYYGMFAQMESSISQANSQMEALVSMLGS